MIDFEVWQVTIPYHSRKTSFPSALGQLGLYMRIIGVTIRKACKKL
jgi:hypothetical protein